MKSYFVYILTNQSRSTLYVRVTSELDYRLAQHRAGTHDGSTKKYGLTRLVYADTIAREKQLKNWHRQWKISLIESQNPNWNNLSPRPRMDAETSSA